MIILHLRRSVSQYETDIESRKNPETNQIQHPMKLKRSIILTGMFLMTFLFVQAQISTVQPKQKDYYPMDYSRWALFMPGNDSVSPFYISTKPITNKEYILFLVWSERVYGEVYPQVFFDALPGLVDSVPRPELFDPFSDTVSFKFYLDNSESYVREYIFNSAYLDYPVIGISWEQANRFCRWLSDRYNEYCLIKIKHLYFNYDQMADNSFSTESIIFKQYEGYIGKKPHEFGKIPNAGGFNYYDYLLRPSFHLATSYELELCAKNELPTITKSLYSAFEPYSTQGSEFLQPFYDNFLPESKGSIFVVPYNSDSEPFFLSSDYSFSLTNFQKKLSEWCLDSYLPEKGRSLPEIYGNFGYDFFSLSEFLTKRNAEYANMNELMCWENMDLIPMKDSLGILPLIIIGENKNREFELLSKTSAENTFIKNETYYLFENASKTKVNGKGDKFTCFRFAVNAIKK
jgi:hypothetical protein